LQETGGIQVSARQIQRLVQQVGAAAQTCKNEGPNSLSPAPNPRLSCTSAVTVQVCPMRKEELEGRAGKQPDGTAKTRMAYLAASLPSINGMKGPPVRDHDSTTYVSTFSSIEEFGPLLRQEAIRRGLALAMQVVLLIDGANGLANMGRLCFSTAIQIVDFYHALEHAGKVLVALLGSKEHPDYKTRLRGWAKQLLKDQVEKLIAQVRQECAGKSSAEAVEKELGYFVNNVKRMQYGTFRRQGFSSARALSKLDARRLSEPAANIRHVLGQTRRSKHLGVALYPHQPQLDEFWKERLNAHSARTIAWRFRRSRRILSCALARWIKMTGPGKGDDFFRCNGAGEMLVFSAADFEDFLEPRPNLPSSLESELKDVVTLLAANKWPFRLHATYDESINRFLNVYEEVNRDVPFQG